MNSRCQKLGSSAVLRGPEVQYRCIHSSPGRRRLLLRVQAAKTESGPSVAIVGVTGAVGQEFLRVGSPLAPCTTAFVECTHRALREQVTVHNSIYLWSVLPESATIRVFPSSSTLKLT